MAKNCFLEMGREFSSVGLEIRVVSGYNAVVK